MILLQAERGKLALQAADRALGGGAFNWPTTAHPLHNESSSSIVSWASQKTKQRWRKQNR